ncbi:hypothetical protein Cni_G07701 [Canna indica]|uniref:Uncharacterized protein n=1 Tax=Canna indica TaxID=4628 RepID=A0AAQ3JYY3_9LILI|nr:hypothetical protein Cni_G07701 [Canna indica]
MNAKDLANSYDDSNKGLAKLKSSEPGVQETAPAKSTSVDQEEDGKKEAIMISGAVLGNQSLKVSWHPHGVVLKEHQGFDVDYVGPRTHSPSHN